MDSAAFSRRQLLWSVAVAAGTASALALSAQPAAAHTGAGAAARAGDEPFPERRTYWSGHWPDKLKAAARDAMPAAVQQAHQGYLPFGAVLVDAASGRITAEAYATIKDGDLTAHAEMNLLHVATAQQVPAAAQLVVSTAEPCPMCAGALLWSNVAAVAYGTTIAQLIADRHPQIDVPFAVLADRAPFTRPAVARGLCADLTDPLYRDLTPPPASTV